MASSSAPKKVSLAFGAKLAKHSKPSNGLKRPHAALHDSDDEDNSTAQHQEISSFDQSAGGAIRVNGASNGKGGPLVIKAMPNSDRLEYGRKKQKSGLPAEQNLDNIQIKMKEVTFGLTVPEARVAGDADMQENAEQDTTEQDTPRLEKTEDEKALDALLGNTTSSRTIQVADEDEALKRDLEDAQDVPTLDQYLSIPVSEFGAACLRGMGWKDTETLGTKADQSQHILKPKPVERRPALLGVGAKPSSAVGFEIGEWGKNAKGKKAKNESYNPVVLRNKTTGQVLTEQELNAKLQDQDKGGRGLVFEEESNRRSEKESRRSDYHDSDRDSRRDRDDRDRRREKDRDRDRRDKYDRDDRDRRRRNHSDEESDQKSRRKDDSRSNKYDRDDRDRRDKYKDDKYRDDRRDKYRDETRDKYRDDRSDKYKNDSKDTKYKSDRYEKSSSRKYD